MRPQANETPTGVVPKLVSFTDKIDLIDDLIIDSFNFYSCNRLKLVYENDYHNHDNRSQIFCYS